MADPIESTAPPAATVVGAPSRSRPSPLDRLSPGRLWRSPATLPLLAVAAGVAGQIAIRLALYWTRTGPLIYPDEAGYLLGARRLAGGPAADLSGLTSYQGGYSLLLAPLYLVSHDPEVVYRLVMCVNAVIGAALFPLGGLALVRCGLRREEAFALAWAAAFLPATTLYGGLAMADALLPAVVLAWVLTLDRFVRSGRPAPALAASALAACAYSIHLRGAVVLVVHAGVLIYCLWRGGARRQAGLALGATAAAAALVMIFNMSLASALYPAGTRDLGTILVDRMTSLDGQVRALTGAIGQIWAMMTGTWGLAALGFVALAGVMSRRGTGRADRVMAATLLATTAGIAYASSAALPNEFRVGNFAYGRYASCLSLIFALVGIAVLLRKTSVPRGLAAAAAVIWGAGLWLVGYLGERLHSYEVYPWDVPEIGLLGGGYQHFRPMVISAVACALLLVLWGLSRWAAGALTIGVLTISLVLTWLPLTIWQTISELSPAPGLPGKPAGGVAVARLIPGVDHPGSDVAHPVPELIYSRVALSVWWTEPQRFDPDDGPPPAGVCKAVVFWPAGVVAADTWPRHPSGWRYQRAGTIGALTWVFWYDPGCPG